MSHNGDSSTEGNGNEPVSQTVSIGELLRTIVQIRALGAHQTGEDDVTSQELLQQLLSAGSFRLVRMPGDDTTASQTGDNNDLGVEDNEPDDDDDGDDDEMQYSYWRRPHAKTPKWFSPVTTPQKEGIKLLMSGEFGRVGVETRSRNGDASLTKAILSRRSKLRQTPKQDITNAIIPNTNGTAVASLTDNIYCGQYSADFRLHIYDMTVPPTNPKQVPRPGERYSRRSALEEPTTMKVIKVIQGTSGGWTITDAHLSPDNESQFRIIYSSIDSTVHMATTLDPSTAQIPIPFADPLPTRRRGLAGMSDFGIWSCKFSADGNEVIAGGDGKIFVYDLLANRRTVKINAHQDDVNSCCWADTASGNVLISASDDTFLKVWDRRSLGSSQKPSGITNVSAKGDGRYVISNGKDQALRLWDLRKMRTNAEYEEVWSLSQTEVSGASADCSVMTYRGHAVLQTLIRCHFSPAETTGGQYIYSGSADGKIHIWSLDGRVVQILDRSKTLPMAFDPSGPEPESLNNQSKAVCVRDVSWHSKLFPNQEPVIMSAGWSSGHGGSVVARHEWKGLLKMPGALEDFVEKQRLESQECSTAGQHDTDSDLDDEYMPEFEDDNE
ncbi:WD40-repeat-containing domain protein [Multifurca ochricompacta]|uniref:WD40-repeat-containing domain protein n=1 Tax=Multifurca ochricompacta TaxID=376703 RepID=A0AAD4MDG5_9AGAM|nr:WD40-repeat-containing domain protein [Multifurca ochricompacta]